MKDEIKEILDRLRNCDYDDFNKVLDYITNLQEKYNEYKNLYFSEHKVKENYKSRNEKANNEVIRVLQIILEQPSKDKLDDLWIINKLEGIQTLLQGEDKDE